MFTNDTSRIYSQNTEQEYKTQVAPAVEIHVTLVIRLIEINMQESPKL